MTMNEKDFEALAVKARPLIAKSKQNQSLTADENKIVGQYMTERVTQPYQKALISLSIPMEDKKGRKVDAKKLTGGKILTNGYISQFKTKYKPLLYEQIEADSKATQGNVVIFGAFRARTAAEKKAEKEKANAKKKADYAVEIQKKAVEKAKIDAQKAKNKAERKTNFVKKLVESGVSEAEAKKAADKKYV